MLLKRFAKRLERSVSVLVIQEMNWEPRGAVFITVVFFFLFLFYLSYFKSRIMSSESKYFWRKRMNKEKDRRFGYGLCVLQVIRRRKEPEI